MYKVFLVFILFFSAISSLIGCVRQDPLADKVIKADLIVLGTISDNRTDVMTVVSENSTGKFAYTLFTLSVEKVIKGDPSTKEAIIRVEGGYIGDGIYQFPTGAYFSISDRVLALLHLEEGNVYTLCGMAWFESTANGLTSRESLSDSIGRIIQIMVANKIPIALPASEWPPLPAPIPVSPPKN